MPRHPNKEIQVAVEYAIKLGWRLEKAGPRAHIWGSLYCPLESREGCIIRVFSTPRQPRNHVRRIRREIRNCTHTQRRIDTGKIPSYPPPP